jgi:ubiquinone/menaquinone biosynthesis C-methylase UbiE
MSARVCPWWAGYFIDNPLRRLLHNPEKILRPHVRPGMTTMDVGCGMGIFSIAMAHMVGPQGRVIAVDVQQRMLDTLQKRAVKAGIAERIQIHKAESGRLGVDAAVDFSLAFAMVHEAGDTRDLLQQIHDCLNPGGNLLVAEPRGHVPRGRFDDMLQIADQIGLKLCDQPPIRLSHSALFSKV